MQTLGIDCYFVKINETKDVMTDRMLELYNMGLQKRQANVNHCGINIQERVQADSDWKAYTNHRLTTCSFHCT